MFLALSTRVNDIRADVIYGMAPFNSDEQFCEAIPNHPTCVYMKRWKLGAAQLVLPRPNPWS